MKKIVPLLISSLFILPLSASACDSHYQNMYTPIIVDNDTTGYLTCEVTSMDGSWMKPSSVFNQIDPGSPLAPTAADTACYSDSGTDDVSGTLTCYTAVDSGGVPTKSVEVGTLSFHHDCNWGLNTSGAGSCMGGYSNGASVGPVNGYDLTYKTQVGTGVNVSEYDVYFQIRS